MKKTKISAALILIVALIALDVYKRQVLGMGRSRLFYYGYVYRL